MVAAECDRQLNYSVFGDHNVEQKLTSFYQFCKSHNVTVGKQLETKSNSMIQFHFNIVVIRG